MYVDIIGIVVIDCNVNFLFFFSNCVRYSCRSINLDILQSDIFFLQIHKIVFVDNKKQEIFQLFVKRSILYSTKRFVLYSKN